MIHENEASATFEQMEREEQRGMRPRHNYQYQADQFTMAEVAAQAELRENYAFHDYFVLSKEQLDQVLENMLPDGKLRAKVKRNLRNYQGYVSLYDTDVNEYLGDTQISITKKEVPGAEATYFFKIETDNPALSINALQVEFNLPVRTVTGFTYLLTAHPTGIEQDPTRTYVDLKPLFRVLQERFPTEFKDFDTFVRELAASKAFGEYRDDMLVRIPDNPDLVLRIGLNLPLESKPAKPGLLSSRRDENWEVTEGVISVPNDKDTPRRNSHLWISVESSTQEYGWPIPVPLESDEQVRQAKEILLQITHALAK